ncbi:MAG: DUF3124 domain-containing protein [Crocinitomicaceae bacterium]
MKKIISFLFLSSFLFSCQADKEMSSVNPVVWANRKANYNPIDSLISGSTYLSTYSEIYSQNEHSTFSLTVTASIRNVNKEDTIYIDKAIYFNTKGDAIRSYFDHPIYISPMETIEIVIDGKDIAGGTGGNFLFDWKTKPNVHEPLFEGVMISTNGQLGISFLTQGIRTK